MLIRLLINLMKILNVIIIHNIENLAILNDLSTADNYIESNEAKTIIGRAHKSILDRMEHFKKQDNNN